MKCGTFFLHLALLVVTVQQAQGSFPCNFDTDLCGWSQDGTDEFDWTRHNGSTPSVGTGPAADHTSGNGSYVYIEASGNRKRNDKARLVSPKMNGSAKCMTFWYNMYGGNLGSLHVYTRSGPSLDTHIYHRSGPSSPYWLPINLNLKSTSPLQVVIEATRGSTFKGDIAIDDISFADGVCTTGCPAGRYGYACAEICGPCKDGDACNAETGGCPKGCQPGKSGTRCKSECCRGTYGENCGGQCGLCKYGEVCDKVTGRCSACQTNLLTPLCQVCVAGWHGPSCEEECKLCAGDGSCDRFSGTCLQGCVHGSIFNNVSSVCEMCSAGWHGPSCEEECKLCAGDGSCDRFSGTCVQGCVHGSIFNNVSSVCEMCTAGWHGPSCEEECKLCAGDGSCDRFSGTCLQGCVNGSVFNNVSSVCEISAESGSKDVDVGRLAGGVAGVGALVILAVIAAVCIRRRRSRLRSASTRSGDSKAICADGNQIELPVMAAAAEDGPQDIPEDEENPYEIQIEDDPQDIPEDEENPYENQTEDENIYDVAEDPVGAAAPYTPVVVRNR